MSAPENVEPIVLELVKEYLSKKTFFHSQKVLDEYKGEKIPEPAAYIEKPPEPEELLEIIQKNLE